MTSFTVPCPKCVVPLPHLGLNSQTPPTVSYRSQLGLKKSLSFGSLSRDSAPNGIQWLKRAQFSAWKLHAQQKEVVTVEKSAPAQVNGPKVASPEEKDEHNGKLSGPSISAEGSSISAFMKQVSDLVKLVDSRDIMELQLKQADCELIIRKKEALQPPVPVPQPYQYPMNPQTVAAAAPPAATPAPESPPPSKATLALPPAKASTSSHPMLKSPMAGTFYRSPAPGEPPFIKVGDKVQKGQVICIIEAMKLMNEIEADQSGTITEVRAEDGKAVSVDTPLFVIVP